MTRPAPSSLNPRVLSPDRNRRPACLLILEPDGQRRIVPLGRDLLTLGAASGSPATHIRIASTPGDALCDRHAVIVREEGGYWIRDESGPEGTRVNGRPVRRKALAHGDVITLGRSPGRIEFILEERRTTEAGDAAVESGMSAHRTRLLIDMLARLHASLISRDIAASAVAIVMKAIGAEWTCMLLDTGSAGLQVEGAGVAAGRLPDAPTRHAGQVMATGRSFFSPDRLCVPIEGGGRRIGVIDVGPRPGAAYTAGDLEMIESVAAHIGVAIGNARRLEGLPGFTAIGAMA